MQPWAPLATDLQSETADGKAPAALGPPLDHDTPILDAGYFGHFGRATAIGGAGYVRTDAKLAGRQFEGADDSLIVAHCPRVRYPPEPAKDDDIATRYDFGAWVQIADQGNVTRVLERLSRPEGSSHDDA